MKRIVKMIAALAVAATAVLSAAETLSKEEFVALARRRNKVATFAKLDGTVQHRRRGKEPVTMPVYFGAILHPDRTIGQLIIDRKEGYLLSQAQGSGMTAIRPMPDSGKSDKLGYVGVRASDLVMSFLFCKVEKEFDNELLRGLIPCRVFLLDDPDNREKIKIWITTEHCFPMKAEFYRYGEEKPFRNLEAGGLTKKNDLYYVRRLRLSGPGWITKIDFEDKNAEIGLLEPGKTPSVTRKLQGSVRKE